MRDVVAAIELEFTRYRALAEGAMAQLDDEQICRRLGAAGSSIAIVVWHVSGNLASRFGDFLTTDGEKPWRVRDEEFAERQATRDEVLAKWHAGWAVLVDTLTGLTDADLPRTVVIRGQGLSVLQALTRSLAHVSYHVGQIVYVAKLLRGDGWTYLSIPPGGSAAYNANPTRETPAAAAAAVVQDVINTTDR
jgi:uncharacterized damage-inducible protein DinB